MAGYPSKMPVPFALVPNHGLRDLLAHGADAQSCFASGICPPASGLFHVEIPAATQTQQSTPSNAKALASTPPNYTITNEVVLPNYYGALVTLHSDRNAQRRGASSSAPLPQDHVSVPSTGCCSCCRMSECHH